MKGTGFLVGLVVILTSIVVLAVVWTSSQSSTLTTYTPEAPEKPKLVFEHDNFDLGAVQMEGIYEHKFLLENQGNRPLELQGFRTSCGCTRVKVKIGEETSPEFSMHNPPSWRGEIPAGQTAEIIATFEPRIHPVRGRVERTILFETNDPLNPNVVLTLKASVKE